MVDDKTPILIPYVVTRNVVKQEDLAKSAGYDRNKSLGKIPDLSLSI